MSILSGIVFSNGQTSGVGANPGSNGLYTIGIAVLMLAVMYFLMIRPQRKKDKEIQQMRNSIQVGDEVVTIGGICGKVVKTKDDTIVIQVGADKNRLEMMRWSVSSITKPSANKDRTLSVEKTEDEEQPKKSLPKRLKKSSEDLDEEV